MSSIFENPRRFSVALTFPGEHREFVQSNAEYLSKEFGKKCVLYDKYHQAEFARPDLDVYLPKLYLKESDLVVVFLCPEYAEKRWCKLEWRYIRNMLCTIDSDRIMFLSFGAPGDLSSLGILRGDGYLDIGNSDPEEISKEIINRYSILGQNGKTLPPDKESIISNIDKNIENVSELFKSICKLGPDELKTIGNPEPKDFLTKLVDFVVNSESVFPLTVQGFVGCGKTWLLKTIYLRLKEIAGEYNLMPIFIDLKEDKGSANEIVEQACMGIKNIDYRQVLAIIDGIDEQQANSITLTKDLLRALDKHIAGNKKLISVGIDKDHARYSNTPLAAIVRLGLPDPQITVLMTHIDWDNDSAKYFLKKRMGIAGVVGVSFEDVVKAIDILRLPQIDLFTLDLIIPHTTSILSKTIVNLPTLLEMHIKNQYNLTQEQLNKLASDLYAALKNQTTETLQHSELASYHSMMRDYLVAKHVFNAFAQSRDQSDELIIRDVFTHEINGFCKDLFSLNDLATTNFLNAVERNVDAMNLAVLPNVCYLLGRVSEKRGVKRCRSLLINLQKRIRKDSQAELLTHEKKLFIERSIYISLAKTKSTKYSNTYIKKLLKNKEWNNVNRGFHLEYYGDMPYSFTKDNLTALDDLSYQFPKTHDILSRNIRSALSKGEKHPLYDIEMFTLISLALSRMCQGCLREEDGLHLEIAVLAKKTKEYFGGGVYEDFLTFACEHLPLGNQFTPLTPLLSLYKLKSTVRTGFLQRFGVDGKCENKEFDASYRLESVAEHTVGCIWLARTLLPDKGELKIYEIETPGFPDIEFRAYNKETIIRMLEVHDWGEWRRGDKTPREKGEPVQHEEWGEARQIFSTRGIGGCYCSDLVDDYLRCEKETTDNAEIAKAIDKLEPLCQLLIYESAVTDKSCWCKFYIALRKELKSSFKDVWLNYIDRECMRLGINMDDDK